MDGVDVLAVSRIQTHGWSARRIQRKIHGQPIRAARRMLRDAPVTHACDLPQFFLSARPLALYGNTLVGGRLSALAASLCTGILVVMVQPLFRLATPADAYEIAVMSRYLVEVGLRGWSWPPERVAKAIRARSTLVVVAEVRSHLVGFAIMEFGDVQAHLSLLAVKPSYHRGGIGRGLMEWLEDSG